MQRCESGSLRAANAGEKVKLQGWVSMRRDHGGLIFIVLRDRSGNVQLSFNADEKPEIFKEAEKLRLEYVIQAVGTVALRDEKNKNPNMETGDIEIIVEDLEILNACQPLPFPIADTDEASEEIRFKYRFLDLRRPKMQNALKTRYDVIHIIRSFMRDNGFWEIETPILTRSTPEGARDYLVPSRKYPGNFFALPQSPQQFKQMLQTAGVEKYFQIARCFRDEDMRGDRQPEFTQLDIEASFIEEDDIMGMTERLFAQIMKEVKNIDITLPLPRMSYAEAMQRYGKDAPDTRFGLELINCTELAKKVDFKLFTDALEAQGKVYAINASGAGKDFSRKQITELENDLKSQFPRVKGLLWTKIENNAAVGGIAKFFDETLTKELCEVTNAKDGDLLFFIADAEEIVFEGLGTLRLWLGKKLNLINENQFNYLWVVDFPMFEYAEEENRLVARHHPFTQPKNLDFEQANFDSSQAFLGFGSEVKLYEAINEIKARAYDLVLNGVEVAGGSIRIHNPEYQRKVFKTLSIDEATVEEQFGHLLKALSFGTPPHGGVAAGLDRLVMILSGFNTIREVIPFPKTLQSKCLLTEAPSVVEEKQLTELGISVIPPTQDEE